ncbi:MAG: MFS transporter [Rhodospirillales bacterium]|nr:MFS transporter [Rhodospirillales bacterium]
MPVLFLIVVVDLIGFGIIIPLLPFYAEHYQATPAQVGLLMAVYSAAQFISAPFWGRLSDRVGRRPVLLGTIFAAALSYVWLGLADTLITLFAARALGGLMAGNISTAFAYAADVTTKENRAKGMGMIGAAFSIGFILGPAIGGILAGADPANADFHTPSFAAAGLSALACVLGLFTLKESLSAEARARIADQTRVARMKALADALRTPGVGVLLILAFLATFVFAGLESTFAMWSRRQYGWGPEQNGYLFAFIGVLAAMIQGGLMGKLANKFGVERLIFAGAVALAVGLAWIPFTGSVPELVAAMTLAALGFSITTPALNTAISVRGECDVQGGLMGVTRSATTLSRMTGPAVAGTAFGFIGLHSPYYAGAVIMVIVAAITFFKLLTPPRKP